MVEAPPASARSTVVVRPCAPHEGEALRRLRGRALADAPDAYRQTLAEHERVSSAAWRRHFEARAAAGDATLVAEADGTWSAPIPAAPDGKPAYFEQLWVNGRRADRARLPDGGQGVASY